MLRARRGLGGGGGHIEGYAVWGEGEGVDGGMAVEGAVIAGVVSLLIAGDLRAEVMLVLDLASDGICCGFLSCGGSHQCSR